jgi:hypothetical protein
MDLLGTLSMNTGKIWTNLGVFATVLFWGLVGLGIMWIISYYFKFNYPLHLYIETGTGKRYVKDRGKKDKKERKFIALKNKDIDFPYPETKYEYQQGKKACLSAFIKNQSATWLEISPNPHFIPANYDMQSKMINDLDATWNIIKKELGFWDQYGQQILWVGSLGIFLIVIILILKRMDAIIDMGKSVAMAQASQGKQVVNMMLPFGLLWRKLYNET